MEVLVVCLTAIVIVAILAYAWLRSLEQHDAALGGPELLGADVVVHVVEAESIRGTVSGDYDDVLILRNAHYLDAGGKATPAKGTVQVHQDRVGSVQVMEYAADRPASLPGEPGD